MRMVFQVVAIWLIVIAAARGQGEPGPTPPSGGPWNHRVLSATSRDGLAWTRDRGVRPEAMAGPWDNDVLVYRVGPGGKVTQVATFERAGVATIARMKDGRLIAAHQHFPENDETSFDKVAVRFSSDEGKTWTAPRVVRLAGLPEGMRFPFDPTLVPLPDGRVRLYFTSLRGRRFEEGVPAIYSAISDNGVDYTFEPGVRFRIEARIVIDCAVVLHQGVFHLYAPDNGAQRRAGAGAGQEPDGAPPRPGVGYYATSKDGLHFARAEDVQIEGGRRWLGNAQSDGKVITFIGTGDPGEPGFPGAGQPRGGVWMGTSSDGQAWRLVQRLPIPVADPGAVASHEGGWVVVGTGPPRRGTPGAEARFPFGEPSPGPAAQRPDGRPFPGPDARRVPRILTHVPCPAGGERGIAVGVLPPLKPRYADGAPVVIHVPGGVATGATEGPPEYAGLGFVEIRFAFPGGGRGDGASGGTYDFRGPNCIRALADVIRFATGRRADQQGRKIQDLLPLTTVLTGNVGLVGSSHGGNACGLVMATHGEEFPDLAFYASMESPYGEGNVNIELGGRDQDVNPAYDPQTGVLDLSKLAWSAELTPGPPRRWQGEGTALKGALFFDLSDDGRFSESDDYPANVFVQDLGQGPKAWYSPRLVREAEQRKLYGGRRPDHIPSLAESTEYWRWRDAAGSIDAAVRKCPKVAVIVYANQRDHVQVAPDHPHILAQVEGFRQAGARFVRLNPDRAYIERILAAGGPPLLKVQRVFPDNDAGVAWDRGNIRSGLEPEDLPMPPFMQAAGCELADRVEARNWSKNLDAVLYPDAPWTAFGGRRAGLPPDQRPPRPKPPLRPGGVRPPLGRPPLGGMKPAPSEAAGPQTLRQRISADAGSKDAPLLFCIGVHVEPLGATVSSLARTAAGDMPLLRPPLPGVKPGRLGPKLGPSYELEGLFRRHVADLQTLAQIVERHGGKLTVQAQTPFTRKLAEAEHPLLPDFERRGHEIALHFHEDAHLGRGGALPVETWTAVMREEIDWLKKAGASRIRYWSGGNLYPQVLEAASHAGLEVMSDYKNPRTQRDDQRLLAVNPWRPAEGPSEADLAGFGRHSPAGKIVYLPNGVFERADHSAMRRSADVGGEYPYFDALTRGLELSLRAARPARVNVFHITVHAGEFRGGPQTPRPFAVIDDWLGEVVTPLVKAGKVRWATFSEMADAFKAWEKANPDVSPRVGQAAGSPGAVGSGEVGRPVPSTGAEQKQGYITFVINTHDWGRVDKSADTILRLIELFTRYQVRGDFYLTAPVVEAYAQSRPEVLARLRDGCMTISYHFRPPHPAYSGFDAALRGLDEASLRATLRDYETFRLDLATGGLDRDRPGGYAYVKQVLGMAPVTVSALGNPRAKTALLGIYRELGAQMTMEYHESGTTPDEPLAWRQGLLIRPSDFSITRWAAPGETRESFWWMRQDTPQVARFNPTARLQSELAAWQHHRAPLITALIHENDFYVRGGPSWNAIYYAPDGRTPRKPPYDLDTPDRAEPRTAENQAAIWRAYEELVAYAAENLAVVTSAEIVSMAKKADAPVSQDKPARTQARATASEAVVGDLW